MTKKIILVFAVMAICLNLTAQNNVTVQQIPDAIAYPGRAYNANGDPLNDQNITIRASVLSGSSTGNVEWQEVHSITTLDDGTFTINIGRGTRTGGNKTDFKDIAWSDGQYFLKMEMDASGGNNFGDAAIDEFCSVPFSFRAAVADSLRGLERDSLGRVLNSVCCDLQNTYLVGNTITPPTGNQGVLISSANLVATPLLNVNTSFNGNNLVSFNQTASLSSFINTNIQMGGAGTALRVYHSGIGRAIDVSTTNTASTNSGMQLIHRGQGSGALFELRNVNSNRASIKAQITNVGVTSNLASAGQFLINNSTNTADAIYAETNGTGNAGSFLSTGVATSIKAENMATGNVIYGLHSGTSGSAMSLLSTDANNPADFIHLDNSGAGYGITFIDRNLNKTGQTMFIDNRSRGSGLEVSNSTNTGNGAPTALITNQNASGNAMQIIAKGLTGYNNTQAGVEVWSQNDHKGAALRVYSLNDVQQSPGIVTIQGFSTTNQTDMLHLESHSNTFPTLYAASYGQSSYAPAGVFANNNSNILSDAVYADNAHTANYNAFSSPFPAAVQGNGSSGATGVAGVSSHFGFGVYGENVYQDGYAGYFNGNVHVVNDFTVAGNKNALVKNAQGEKRVVSCEESMESWFTDYGGGQLNNGSITITIDPNFASITNCTNQAYRVFIQPEGDCKGLYVSNKTSTSFTVTELQGGTSNINFSYRITAKRKGYENLRFPTEEQSHATTAQYLQANWPELINQLNAWSTENQEKAAQLKTNHPVQQAPAAQVAPAHTTTNAVIEHINSVPIDEIEE